MSQAPSGNANPLHDMLGQAIALHQRGMLSDAENAYRDILRLQPDHTNALHLLGLIALQTQRVELGVELIGKAVKLNPHAAAYSDLGIGLYTLNRLEQALASYDMAIALQPDHAEAHSNRGVVLNDLRRYQDAVSSYDRAIALKPDYAAAHNNRGNALRDLQRYQDALLSYDWAIALRPAYAEAYNNRGNALSDLRRHDDALAAYDQAIALQPDHAEAHYNRGNLLRDLRRHADAVTSYDRAIALRPDHAVAHNNRGTVLGDLQRHADALASYDKAIALQPDYADAHYNRGNVLRELRRYDDAVASYDKALALKPNHAETYTNRGNALGYLRRHEDALLDYGRATALQPEQPEAYINAGNALCDLGRYDEAQVSYDKAIALKPDLAEAQFHKGMLLLQSAQFERGWALYEWRKKLDKPAGNRRYQRPVWLGNEDIAGKTLFVHWEQGFGDTIQFCRYAKLAHARGAHVVMSVQDPLLPLLAQLGPAIQVIGANEQPAAFDYHCPLMSLPLALGTTLETIPAEPRYIAAAEQPRAAWSARLGPKTRPRAGVVWRGNPEQRNNHIRSIGLAALLPLLIDDVEWICLHKEVDRDEAALLRQDGRIAFAGDDLKDFGDTAALIDHMDLVVTTCTSVAHLAAAMGKPTWIMLTYNPDWRWLRTRTDSPWYPSARLFRQAEPGNWAAVADQVRRALTGSIGK